LSFSVKSFSARTPGERVGGENVQALDPVGHPSSGDPGDLLDVAELAAVGEVVVVCGPIAFGENGVRGQTLLHRPHQPG